MTSSDNRKCLNCAHWKGGKFDTWHGCSEIVYITRKNYYCDKWEAKNGNTETLKNNP